MSHPTVGNKDDDPERKVVERDDAVKFAEQMGIQVFETSAKDNKNVEEVCVMKLSEVLQGLGPPFDGVRLCVIASFDEVTVLLTVVDA